MFFRPASGRISYFLFMELVFASNNKNKLKEVRQILGPVFKVLSLSEIKSTEELPETSDTIEGNASQKAFYIYHKFRLDCFADDTGLEIDALGGRPGVLSARYAGPDCNPEDNIRKVLKELDGIQNRKAVFRCVISLVIGGSERQFEGVMEGKILAEKQGKEGFGYDPIFAPEVPLPFGEGPVVRSFAEMSSEEKNRISHRAVAVRKMAAYLLSLKK